MLRLLSLGSNSKIGVHQKDRKLHGKIGTLKIGPGSNLSLGDVGVSTLFFRVVSGDYWQTLKIEWDRIPMDPGPFSKLLAS